MLKSFLQADEFCQVFVEKPSGEKDSDNYEEDLYPNAPYMHALQFHLIESLESAAEWGCSLNQLSTQSIEYKNFEQVWLVTLFDRWLKLNFDKNN